MFSVQSLLYRCLIEDEYRGEESLRVKLFWVIFANESSLRKMFIEPKYIYQFFSVPNYWNEIFCTGDWK